MHHKLAKSSEKRLIHPNESYVKGVNDLLRSEMSTRTPKRSLEVIKLAQTMSTRSTNRKSAVCQRIKSRLIPWNDLICSFTVCNDGTHHTSCAIALTYITPSTPLRCCAITELLCFRIASPQPLLSILGTHTPKSWLVRFRLLEGL